MIDLKQKELYLWQHRNFPITHLLSLNREELIRIILILQVTLGINEEAGEVAHTVLKGVQGIRGGVNGIDAKEVANGVGDNLIYGMQLLSLLKLDAEKEIPEVIAEVLARDWVNNPENGTSAAGSPASWAPELRTCNCDCMRSMSLNNQEVCSSCLLPV